MTHMTLSAVVFGAGRTGRGLAADLCRRNGVEWVLVDRNPALVTALSAAGSYELEILGAGRSRLVPQQVATLADDAWFPALGRAQWAFTAVVGSNFPALAPRLAAALVARAAAGNTSPLDIITCENLTHAAAVLRAAVAAHLPAETRDSILARTGFVEAMVLTTSLGPADPVADPLAVRSQNLLRLPCDGEAFRGDPRPLAGLEPLPRFANQLQRKIHTYNGINAVVSYLGALRGHTLLAPASTDPVIRPWAIQAGDEASRALIAEFGFAPDEQAAWAATALAKFSDPLIPDPITRNAGDPARKLAREDRLVGPALLALRHGIIPLALARGIAAATRYRDGVEPSLLQRHGTVAAVLAATAGLEADHPLVRLAEDAGDA